jgi:hypothetical protein
MNYHLIEAVGLSCIKLNIILDSNCDYTYGINKLHKQVVPGNIYKPLSIYYTYLLFNQIIWVNTYIYTPASNFKTTKCR